MKLPTFHHFIKKAAARAVEYNKMIVDYLKVFSDMAKEEKDRQSLITKFEEFLYNKIPKKDEFVADEILEIVQDLVYEADEKVKKAEIEEEDRIAKLN